MSTTPRKSRLIDPLDFWHAFFGPRRRLVQLVLSLDETQARAIEKRLEQEIGQRVTRAKMDQKGGD